MLPPIDYSDELPEYYQYKLNKRNTNKFEAYKRFKAKFDGNNSKNSSTLTTTENGGGGEGPPSENRGEGGGEGGGDGADVQTRKLCARRADLIWPFDKLAGN